MLQCLHGIGWLVASAGGCIGVVTGRAAGGNQLQWEAAWVVWSLPSPRAVRRCTVPPRRRPVCLSNYACRQGNVHDAGCLEVAGLPHCCSAAAAFALQCHVGVGACDWACGSDRLPLVCCFPLRWRPVLTAVTVVLCGTDCSLDLFVWSFANNAGVGESSLLALV